MKHLLCIIALAISGISMGAVASGQEAGQAETTGKPVDSPVHSPLIEVRYVLLKAPQEPEGMPKIEIGSRDPAISPFSLDGRRSVLLRDGYVNPNMYLCSGWGCFF